MEMRSLNLIKPKTNETEIEKAINSTGYKVTDKKKLMEIQLKSEITCPNCGHKKVEDMPTDACQFFTSARIVKRF